MLNDNIKNKRLEKGLTQKELAIKLNVVRQTVSKWEKGLSIPDADMIEKIAQVLECDVTTLLDISPSVSQDPTSLLKQLAHLNEQMNVQNRYIKIILKIIVVCLSVFIIVRLLNIIIGSTFFLYITSEPKPYDLSFKCNVVDENNNCISNYDEAISSDIGNLIILNPNENDLYVTFKNSNGDVLFNRNVSSSSSDTFNINSNEEYYVDVAVINGQYKDKYNIFIFNDDSYYEISNLYWNIWGVR